MLVDVIYSGFPTQDDMRLRGDFNENSIVNTLSNEKTKVSNSEKRDLSLSTPSSTDEAVENVHFFKWMIGIVLALNLLLVACASRKIRRAALRSPPGMFRVFRRTKKEHCNVEFVHLAFLHCRADVSFLLVDIFIKWIE